MVKKLNYVAVLFCVIFAMATRAQAGESYGYITSDIVSGNTTRQTDADMVSSVTKVLENYDDMEGYSKKYVIPGLKHAITYNPNSGSFIRGDDRFVPQGICVAGQYLLISAYDIYETYTSVIYVLNVTNNAYITTLVLPDVSHAGGVAYDTGNGYIWVCTDDTISCFSYSLLKEAVTGVTNSGSSTVSKRGIYLKSYAKVYDVLTEWADYCTYYDGLLWVGQFEPDTVADIYAYTVDLSKNTLTSKYLMEAPEKTQGMAFYKSGSTVYLVISTSWGRTNDSKIIIYNPSYSSPQTVSGKTYKRILKNNRVDEYTFSPMTEGVAISNTYVYILFESGATYYLEPKEGDTKDTKPIDQYLLYSTSSFLNV